ncbi:MAG: copper resistance protein B [Phenylobacterium sp.]|uniref:copper resistance protein B n=1 Tax=Phenylobacterium sp. TaxID=1871053 RepID=UPI00391D5461
MIRTSLLALLLAGSATAALAQTDPHAGHTMPAAPAAADPHAGHQVPTEPGAAPAETAPPTSADPHAGHQMPAPAAGAPHAGHAMPAAPAAAPADPHAGHAMPAEPPAAADPHAGHATEPAAGGQTGADLPVGNAPPPEVIRDSVADRVFGRDAMARARSILENEHGAARVSKLQADLLEWAPDGDRYGWEVEGWYGGDINRFAFKSEGEGQSGEGVESAEIQLLYSRAVARYTDLQAGVRYDLEPRGRAYATVGVDAMFPYWFEAEGALFLSDRGDLLARAEGSYDLRLTQRLILQPRAELEFAAQDIPESQIGSGLSSAELGLRLRYEIRREFAPYVGVSYERSIGDTADFVRAHGEKAESTRFVVGLRAWF